MTRCHVEDHNAAEAAPINLDAVTAAHPYADIRGAATASGDLPGPTDGLSRGEADLSRRLRLGGFQHDLAAGDGALWALNNAGRTHTTLERFDLQTGRTTGSLDVPGIADALIVKPDAIWIATVIAPPNQPANGYDVIRINPRTLRRALLVHVL
jgi:hypothetical protein